MNVHFNNIGPAQSSFSADPQVLVFKTNLRSKKEVLAIGQVLDQQPGIHRWNVDRQDEDNVLRIECSGWQADDLVALVRAAGYCCEELPD